MEVEWIDIMGSGAVLRRIIRSGGGSKPEYKQEVC